jgi:hypothetical protein
MGMGEERRRDRRGESVRERGKIKIFGRWPTEHTEYTERGNEERTCETREGRERTESRASSLPHEGGEKVEIKRVVGVGVKKPGR